MLEVRPREKRNILKKIHTESYGGLGVLGGIRHYSGQRTL